MNDKRDFRLFVLFASLLLTRIGMAQDTVQIRITYSAKFKYTTNDRPRTDVNILDIGQHSSLYYSFTAKRRAEINDSILSRGGSAEDALGVITKMGFGGSRTRYNVYKNYPVGGQMAFYWDRSRIFYEEAMPELGWQRTEGDTIIAGYRCERAEANFRGRRWTAWYAREIPVGDGPWKLHGLPGLILFAEDAQGDFSFNCIGIEKGSGQTIAVVHQSRYMKGTPKKIEELERLFYRDEIQHAKQTLGIKMVGRYDASGRLVRQQPREPCLLEPEFEQKSAVSDAFHEQKEFGMGGKTFSLQEVKVKPTRIRQHGDTLSYNVASFREKQDRSIADVIARMPGLEVKPDGTIQYQGRDINKFYVEGMDLLGGRYAQASENLSADMVRSVEVMENHQPVKALRDIRFSEQAALNIVLKENAKNVWSGVADIGTGATLQSPVDWLRDLRLLEMLFARKVQSISMYKQNNTGKDVLHEVGNLAERNQAVQTESPVLSDIRLSAPALDQQRSLFNDSHLGATNWLFKTPEDNDLRLQLNFLYDRNDQWQARETMYSDLIDGTVITEDRNVRGIRTEYTGEMLYRVNKDKNYLTNTLTGYADFNRSHGKSLYNNREVQERVKPRKRYISDKFELIRKISSNRSFSLSSSFNYTHLPATLLVSDGSTEQITLGSLYWDTHTSFRHKISGFYITYLAGFRLKSQKMNAIIHDEATDRYREQRIYLTPIVNYQHQRLKFNLRLPISLLHHSYNGDNRSRLIVEPTALVNYEFSPYLSTSVNYILIYRPSDVKTISSVPIYTSYATMRKGSGRLESTTMNMATLSLQYKNVVAGLFANANFSYSGLRNIRLYQSRLTGNGIYFRESTDHLTNSDVFHIYGRISQSLGTRGFSVSLNGNYLWNNYHLLVGQNINSCRMQEWGIALGLSYRPLPFLSFEGESTYKQYRQNNLSQPTLSKPSINTFRHRLKTYILPKNWQIEWNNECYHSSDKSMSFNFFSDFSVSYRTKTYEIGVCCNNVLGNRDYEHQLVTTTQTVYTINRLRPRELLAKLSLNL